MANVQKRLQAMTVEFEEMSRTGIFSKNEVRIRMKKATEYENKIDGYSRSLKNYNDYIDYELCIFRLLKTRRKRLKNGEKKNNLEHRILRRIKGLFDTTLQFYPANKEQYLKYYKFCRESHFIHAASHICENMVKYHDTEDVWLTAARWHVHDGNDMLLALKFLKRGLAIHKESKILYTECIYYEIRNVKNSLDTVENSKQSIDTLNTLLQKYLEKMTGFIKDSQYYVDLLVWMESYDFTMPTQNEIIKHLLDPKLNHSENEMVWDMVAQRERRGIHYRDINDDVDVKINDKTQLLFCIKCYKLGLDRVPQKNKKALWSVYIKCLLEINAEDFQNSGIDKRDLLITAFKDASVDACLSEDGYICWLEFVNDEQARTILQIATEQLPKSVDLWKLRLRYDIFADCRSDILLTFRRGYEALKDESGALWIMLLRYHILSSNDDEIEDFYKEAIKQHHNIAHQLMPKYIEWLAMKRDISKCREVYHSLARVEPHCKNLHFAMSMVEANCVMHDITSWEKVHNFAVEQFPEDLDVWLNFMDFHIYYKESPMPEFTSFFEKAKAALPNHIFLVFDDKCKTKFNKLSKLAVDNNNATVVG